VNPKNLFTSMALIGVAVISVGCASNSGIVSMGKDSYFTSRQAATGFSGAGTLKAETLTEAGAFCGAKGKELEVLSLVEAKPPYIFGNYPKADLQFKCK
jgi:hypothetical protein